MENIFLYFVSLSISTSLIIPIIFLSRLLLKNSPKIFSYCLWSVVFIGLTVSIKVPMTQNSAIPTTIYSAQSTTIENLNTLLESYTAPTETFLQGTQQYEKAVSNGAVPIYTNDNVYTVATKDRLTQPITYKVALIPTLSLIWTFGVLCGFVWYLYQIIKTYGSVRFSSLKQDNIYIDKVFSSPFVFGIFSPKIYMPEDISHKDFSFALAHEQTHIKRKDYLIKPLCFLISILHWYNPLVWLSYRYMCKDMEMSCDEAVIKKFGFENKTDYSLSLLNFASITNEKTATVVLFGEHDSKTRIKNALKFKPKSKFYMIALTCVAVCFGIMFFVSNDNNTLPNILPATSSNNKLINTNVDQEKLYNQLKAIANTDDVLYKYRKMVMSEELVDNDGNTPQNGFELPNLNVKQTGIGYQNLTGVRIDDYPNMPMYSLAWISSLPNEQSSLNQYNFLENGETNGCSFYSLNQFSLNNEKFISYDNLGNQLTYAAFYSTDSISLPNEEAKSYISIRKTYLSNKQNYDFETKSYHYAEISEIYTFPADELGQNVRGLRFFNENLGFMNYAKDDKYSTIPTVKITLDGGKSWQDVDFSQLTASELFNGYRACCMDVYGDTIQIRLNALQTNNDNNNYNKTEPYYLISEDCGLTWAGYTNQVDFNENQEVTGQKLTKVTDTLPLKFGTPTSNILLPSDTVNNKLGFTVVANGSGTLSRGFTGEYPNHSGIDLAAPSGTPILAVDDGIVIKVVRSNTGYGIYLILQHDNYQSLYAQCNELSVELGQEVKKGDVIATVGNTGDSTGSHLHFEIRLDDKPVNPLEHLNK